MYESGKNINVRQKKGFFDPKGVMLMDEHKKKQVRKRVMDIYQLRKHEVEKIKKTGSVQPDLKKKNELDEYDMVFSRGDGEEFSRDDLEKVVSYLVNPKKNKPAPKHLMRELR